MTTQHIFSRSLAVLSAAFTLTIALIAAPSTARAETGNQIVMSDDGVDCPPCRLFKVHDQNGLTFSDVAVEVQNGNQIVITAEVSVIGTAGKPRAGSVAFTAYMEYSGDMRFMDYTDDACMPSLMSRQASAQACDAVSRALREAATAATAPEASAPAPSAPDEGIIMRDGGICDPIRHMGC